MNKGEALKAFLQEKKSGDYVFYSYWFDGWATILALLKKKQVINLFHSRAPGFDMYEELSEYGFIPFRKLQLKEVNTVSAVSKAGLDYLIHEYPAYKEKFQLHHLQVLNSTVWNLGLQYDLFGEIPFRLIITLISLFQKY